ncbi:hypothetical protein XANCAGTX0491_006319 [Xanthoria calcicola]
MPAIMSMMTYPNSQFTLQSNASFNSPRLSNFRQVARSSYFIQRRSIKERQSRQKAPSTQSITSKLGFRPPSSGLHQIDSEWRGDALDGGVFHAKRRRLLGPVTLSTSPVALTCTVCHELQEQSFHRCPWLMQSSPSPNT